MAAARYGLLIEQAATLTRVFTWYTDATQATPVNLTGYTAKLRVKDGLGAVVLDSTGLTPTVTVTLGGAAGTITVVVTATVTAGLTPTAESALAWDLELTSGTGVVTRLVEGSATVRAGVSL